MRKIIIFICILILISSLSVNAYFRDDYWECTSNSETTRGDAFGRFPVGRAFTSDGVCQRTCCILCVARSPGTNCFGGDAKPMCSCSRVSDTSTPVINVLNPVTNTVYNTRKINFDIISSERVKLEVDNVEDTRRGFRTICSSCFSYSRSITFKEGINNIIIRATDLGNNMAEKSLSFVVDSKKPIIKKQMPKKGGYTDGIFTVEYYEENVKEVILEYIQNGVTNIVTRNDCPSGKHQSCTFTLDNLQQGDLSYRFMIKDSVNTVERKFENVIIDSIDPVLSVNNGLYYSNKINFDISVSEDAKLEYIDNSDTNPRFKKFCNSCNLYQKSKNFKSGVHNLVIRATDKAGNTDEEIMTFTVN